MANNNDQSRPQNNGSDGGNSSTGQIGGETTQKNTGEGRDAATGDRDKNRGSSGQGGQQQSETAGRDGRSERQSGAEGWENNENQAETAGSDQGSSQGR